MMYIRKKVIFGVVIEGVRVGLAFRPSRCLLPGGKTDFLTPKTVGCGEQLFEHVLVAFWYFR